VSDAGLKELTGLTSLQTLLLFGAEKWVRVPPLALDYSRLRGPDDEAISGNPPEAGS
jgi:hypothetical protein